MQPTNMQTALWKRRGSDWHYTRDGHIIAVLERTYDGWFCYAQINGRQRLVGAAGRSGNGKRILEHVCATRLAPNQLHIGPDDEAPL